MQKAKKKSAMGLFSDSPVEAITDMGREIVTEGMNDMWDQIVGNYPPENDSSSHAGDLQPGQELDLSPKPQKEAGINYGGEIIHGEKKISRETEQQLSQQIQEIVTELERMIASSTELATQFKDVALVTTPAGKPGKYHVNFFRWVLSLVKTARIQVEDSGAWLAMFKSKKGQKQYWAMFKKHGTTFGMSNERNVATQVG